MSTVDLKNDVLSFVDKADDRLLKMMKALAESYQETEKETSSEEIPEWQKIILDERLADLKANPQRGREWVEVKADLLKKYGL